MDYALDSGTNNPNDNSVIDDSISELEDMPMQINDVPGSAELTEVQTDQIAQGQLGEGEDNISEQPSDVMTDYPSDEPAGGWGNDPLNLNEDTNKPTPADSLTSPNSDGQADLTDPSRGTASDDQQVIFAYPGAFERERIPDSERGPEFFTPDGGYIPKIPEENEHHGGPEHGF